MLSFFSLPEIERYFYASFTLNENKGQLIQKPLELKISVCKFGYLRGKNARVYHGITSQLNFC